MMKRTITSLIVSVALGCASVSVAQTSADAETDDQGQDSVLQPMSRQRFEALTPEQLREMELEDFEAPELPELEASEFATRTLDYEAGMELLKANNLQIEIARKSLEDAAIIESQTKQIFAPSVNVQAQVTYHSREITMGMGQMFQPFVPYLESVYQNDAALQAYMDANPDQDIRVMAQEGGGSDGDMVVQPHTDYSGTLTVTQPLFTAQIFPAKRLAEIVKEQANASVEVAAQQSLVAYNQLYFQAVTLRQFVSVAQQNVDNAKLTLDQAQILFEEEAGPKFDATRAEVQYRAALRDLRNATTQYELAIRSLATLLRTEADFDVGEPEVIDAPQSLEEIMDAAMDERAEFRAGKLDVERSDAMAREAKARKYPTIMAQGTASLARKTLFTGNIFNWSVGLVASWDIYDGGAASRDRRSARIEQARAELQLEQQRDQIRDEIQQAWLELQNQEGLVEQAHAEVELAKENYELTHDARQLGAASALDVDVAQNQLYQSQLAYVDAVTSRMSSIYNLYILQGTSPMVLGVQAGELN